jgi:hypothetical protein
MHSSVMRCGTHTLITAIRTAVNAWRKREGWSRETAVAHIVERHATMGGPALTGIVFNPETQDTYDRMRVNADRVYRWLDDETKDTNLLPANFITFVLAALPVDLRLQAVDTLLAGTGLHVEVSIGPDGDTSMPQYLRCISKECGEAAAAVADLLDRGENDATLAAADKEIAEAVGALTDTRKAIQAKRRA